MLFRPIILLSALAAVTYASPARLASLSTRDNYPTNIGNPSYCETTGICDSSKLSNGNTQCTGDEKLTCQYYSCNVAWDECQSDGSFGACSNALNTCEPVGGRPISENDCNNLFTGYDGSACQDCTSAINGRCHINPEAYTQFSEGDACKKSTEECLREDSCLSALFDCEYVGGPEISEDMCKHAIIGYQASETRIQEGAVCDDCTSYVNERCLLDEVNLSAFEKDYQII